jgi:hypothetical protein
MNRWYGFLALFAFGARTGAAQDTTAVRDTTTPPAVTLSLAEALQQARTNSPTYRQTVNNAGPAKWAVRNAYGSLLPAVNASSDLGYTGS